MNLRSLFTPEGLIGFLLRLPCVLLAISVHESAHGLAAEKMGDPTARNLGRISLNPFRHFDLIGTICLVLFGFGWANPVPIRPRNFEDPKKGMALSALAGPASNFGMALFGIILHRACLRIFLLTDVPFYVSISDLIGAGASFPCILATVFLELLVIFYSLNIGYGVFNLIPCPPLDGSRILLLFLPTETYFSIMRYERQIMLVLMLVLFTGLLDVPLSFCINAVYRGMSSLVNLIPFLKIY